MPLLVERGGAIVNISSVHALQPSAVNVDYGAAKAAMSNLTKALAVEFEPGSDRESVMSSVVPEMMQLTTGRLVDAQEIAEAVAMLASPRAASKTGTELVVDGGMLKAS